MSARLSPSEFAPFTVHDALKGSNVPAAVAEAYAAATGVRELHAWQRRSGRLAIALRWSVPRPPPAMFAVSGRARPATSARPRRHPSPPAAASPAQVCAPRRPRAALRDLLARLPLVCALPPRPVGRGARAAPRSRDGGTVQMLPPSPSYTKNRFTRAPTQLRLARTHDTNRNRNRFPGWSHPPTSKLVM